MPLDPVPYAIAGGAIIPVESLRLGIYIPTGGREGVAGAGDLAVLPLASPAGSIRVMPGAAAFLNRMAHPTTGGQQSYTVRAPTETVIPIAPTSSGGARTDLVAVIVEDPQYAGQPAPPSVPNGPYDRYVIYQGVPAGTTSLAQVAPGQAGYALARVTLPVSTTVVTSAHITDLRGLVNPRQLGYTKMLDVTATATLGSAAYVTWPAGASWQIDVPSWAQTVQLEAHVANLRVGNDATAAGDWAGSARVLLSTTTSSAVATLRPTPPNASTTDTFGYVVAGEAAVPAAMRGTTVALTSQALRASSTSGVTVAHDNGSLAIVKAMFYEAANAGVWT